MADVAVRRSAVISGCGQYRYQLTRQWNASLQSCVFVMLTSPPVHQGRHTTAWYTLAAGRDRQRIGETEQGMSQDVRKKYQKRFAEFEKALVALTKGLTALDAAEVMSAAADLIEAELEGIDGAIDD
jgi:hypothetical protein